MKSVTGNQVNKIEATVFKSIWKECNSLHIVYGIVKAYALRQNRTRKLCVNFKARCKRCKTNFIRYGIFLCVGNAVFNYRRAKTAKECRCNIVGVSLNRIAYLEYLLYVERRAVEPVGCVSAGNYQCRA